MFAVIAKWFAWLKKATVKDDDRLSHVYSDGERLWATNGHLLHAMDLALGKRGRVTLNEEGALQVEKDGNIPPFADTLPRDEPVASIVVSAESLRHAAEGVSIRSKQLPLSRPQRQRFPAASPAPSARGCPGGTGREGC